jgi:hypothetical protein
MRKVSSLLAQALKGDPTQLGDILDHAADFKKELNLEYDPGGWRPDPEKR